MMNQPRMVLQHYNKWGICLQQAHIPIMRSRAVARTLWNDCNTSAGTSNEKCICNMCRLRCHGSSDPASESCLMVVQAPLRHDSRFCASPCLGVRLTAMAYQPAPFFMSSVADAWPVQAWPPLAGWLSAAPNRCHLVKPTDGMTGKLARQLNSCGRGTSEDLTQSNEVRVAFCLACSHEAAFLQQAK